MKILQEPDMENVSVRFDPKFSDVVSMAFLVIEGMLSSVQAIQRVEHHLFYEDEGLRGKVLSSVGLEEEPILCAKQRIAAIIQANIKGPTKYVLRIEVVCAINKLMFFVCA